MNVHITCTPEFSTNKLKEVVELLESAPGDVSFQEIEPFTTDEATIINEKFSNINKLDSLSFNDLFDYAKKVRIFGKVNHDDFLIVITSIRNDSNWFSAFEGRNIFVHGEEWDLITNIDAKFGIAHQCTENIFQSLINLDIENYQSELNIHHKSIGCINDMCVDKQEIVLKLKTGDICDSCYERALNEGLSISLMAQFSAILEKIREEFIFSRNFKRTHKPELIEVDKDGNVTIGGKLVEITELPRSLYIHFLLNIDGVVSDELCDQRDRIKKIYKVLVSDKRYANDNSIVSMCCSEVPDGVNTMSKIKPTLTINRNRIKEPISKCVGDMLCNSYLINIINLSKEEKIFKINIPKETVRISPEFIEKLSM